MESLDQGSLKCIYFSTWHSLQFTIGTNINIAFFLIFIFITVYLFVFLHFFFPPKSGIVSTF